MSINRKKIEFRLSKLKQVADKIKKSFFNSDEYCFDILPGLSPPTMIHNQHDKRMKNTPPDFWEWVTMCNGISGKFIETLYGYDLSRTVYKKYAHWGGDWFPVADDGCGNFYVIIAMECASIKKYPVVFLNHEHSIINPCDKISYIVASDFEIFLLHFLEKMIFHLNFVSVYGRKIVDIECPVFWFPFDKDKMLKNDPSIKTYDFPMPWDYL